MSAAAPAPVRLTGQLGVMVAPDRLPPGGGGGGAWRQKVAPVRAGSQRGVSSEREERLLPVALRRTRALPSGASQR